jgi:hypothetical protein
VQHPLVVGGGEAGAELPGELHRLVLRQPSDPAQERAQVLAVHVLHGQEEMALHLPDVVHAAHRGVGDLARHPDFVVEPLAAIVVRLQGLGQELQRHLLPELQVVGAVDLAHAAAPHEGDHPVALGEDHAGVEAAVRERGAGGRRLRGRPCPRRRRRRRGL